MEQTIKRFENEINRLREENRILNIKLYGVIAKNKRLEDENRDLKSEIGNTWDEEE